MKSTTNHELPRDLANAVTAAQSVLLKAERLVGALRETGSAIPALLVEERRLDHELGVSEIEGGDITQLRARLDAVAAERAAAGRRRSSAGEGLLQLDRELSEARQTLDRARGLYGASVVEEFSVRWRRACDVLAGLRAEAESLSRALGQNVLTPPPYTARVNPVSNAPEVQTVASGPIQPPPLPETLSIISGVMDRIDAARSLAAAVHQSRQLTARYFVTARERGAKGELSGLFSVTKPFDALGTHFEPGMLLDRGVLSEGSLERYWKGRCIQPVAGDAMIAAA
jgi:hypothetical protein